MNLLNNLTPRERMLALAVAGLAPVLLLFWWFTAWTGRYFSNRQQIVSLRQQIQKQEDLQLDAEMAQQRRFLYRSTGLPSDPNMGQILYADWLNDAVSKKAGLSLVAMTPQGTQSVRFRQGSTISPVFDQYTWKITAEGNLRQLLTFLEAFQSLDMMHRISALTIKPKLVGGSGRDAQSRTGTLRIEAEVQAIALVDADTQRDFASEIRTVEGLSIATEKVLVRNIFGPANNPPRITSSASRSADAGEPISFDITADDPDDPKGLRFELVSSGIEGASLQTTGDPAKVMFEAPALPAERYKFTVRVTDSGFPPKSVEREFSLTVKEKAVARAEPPPPPPPAFKHTQATKITALTGVGDRRECWVDIQTLGKRHRLAVGDSFELDGLKWTVREISLQDDCVTFECAGELRKVKRGKTLDQPFSTESLASGQPSAANAG